MRPAQVLFAIAQMVVDRSTLALLIPILVQGQATGLPIASIDSSSLFDRDQLQETCRLNVVVGDNGVPDHISLTRYCATNRDGGTSWDLCDGQEQYTRAQDGTISLPCLTETTSALLVESGGFAPYWLQYQDPTALHHTLQLRPGASVHVCIGTEDSANQVALAWLEPLDSRVPVLPSIIRPSRPSPDGDGCWSWSNLPALRGTLHLAAVGNRSLTVPIELKASEVLSLGTHKLVPEGSAVLQLLTDGGEVIREATVAFQWLTDVGEFGIHLDLKGEGRVAVPYFDVGVAEVTIAAACCGTHTVNRVTYARIRELTPLRLERLGQIAGRCVSAESTEEGLAAVEVCSEAANSAKDAEKDCIATASDGSFRFPDLAPGSYHLSFETDDRPLVVRRAVSVAPARETDLGDVPLPAGATIRLQLADSLTGDPVPGAELRIAHEDRDLPWATDEFWSTDADGLAVLNRLPVGTHPVAIEADGYAPARVELTATIGPAQFEEVWLSRGGRIQGTVLRNGVPARGDRIELPLVTGRLGAVVDADGSYSVDHLPSGRLVVERISTHFGVRELREVSVSEGETAIVDFGDGGVLFGTIWRGQAPVPGARLGLLRIVSWAPTGDDSWMVASGSVRTPSTAIQSTVTDIKGHFRFEGLQAGEYSLTIQYDRRSQTRRVQISEEHPSDLDLQLDQFRLWGQVRSADSEAPLPGARVVAMPVVTQMPSYSRMGVVAGAAIQVTSWEEGRSESSADGTFELDLPRAGRWRVGAVRDGYTSENVLVDVDAAVYPVEFTLQREGRLRVWVEGPDGLEARGASVHHVRKGIGNSPALVINESVNASGLVMIETRAGEESWVVASHTSYGVSRVEHIVGTEQRDVVLFLSRGASLAITVAEPPDEATQLSWNVTDQESGVSLRPFLPEARLTHSSGTMTLLLRRLPPGPLRYEVGGHVLTHSVADGETEELDLTEDAGGEQHP